MGTDRRDVLNGLDGDDEIRGLGTADIIWGGAGNDVIYGGPGDDEELIGGKGEDVIYGGDGDDFLEARVNRQPDKLYCGKGLDSYFADKSDYVDSSCEMDPSRRGAP